MPGFQSLPARSDIVSLAFGAGYFGDGVDGDATIVGTTTLSKETYYNNLTISSTGVLKPNGYRIFVKGTLTIAAGGSINDDGNGGTGGTGATLLSARNYLGGGGGAGGNGGINAVGSAGGGSGGNSSTNDLGAIPAGGAGGAGGANAGGVGGGAAGPAQGQRWSGQSWALAGRFANGTSFGLWNGGSGGGGGGSNNLLATGGGGGSGAGIVWLSARYIANSGRISANGGKGADGTGTAGDSGGGGGGGGGLVLVVTQSPNYGIVQATGGGSGIAFGAGAAGTVGAIGSTTVLVLS
jgi:hypothetical protein